MHFEKLQALESAQAQLLCTENSCTRMWNETYLDALGPYTIIENASTAIQMRKEAKHVGLPHGDPLQQKTMARNLFYTKLVSLDPQDLNRYISDIVDGTFFEKLMKRKQTLWGDMFAMSTTQWTAFENLPTVSKTNEKLAAFVAKDKNAFTIDTYQNAEDYAKAGLDMLDAYFTHMFRFAHLDKGMVESTFSIYDMDDENIKFPGETYLQANMDDGKTKFEDAIDKNDYHLVKAYMKSANLRLPSTADMLTYALQEGKLHVAEGLLKEQMVPRNAFTPDMVTNIFNPIPKTRHYRRLH
jgi:hypothetical protein